ncbi:YeiH family protein [Oceanirhabdus seepicola]|uniref:Sulfate exporter family transporter n=1 Tax=Oceanirhabdus seepicola TaxID=2828781 RepID=A0A9J6P6R9_9CLOT|nr:putative sulfate exporter family transporter [Oceanirhabdus seepicola]MCM1991956.1 putative sulfate exporter family transporter [Oceanirhabdus seepicola]
MDKVIKVLPGIILTAIISVVSIFFDKIMVENFNLRLEAVTYAIIIGIIYNNILKASEGLKPGIKFSAKKLLKIGIVLLGFKLSIFSIVELGPSIIIMVLILIPSVFVVSNIIGKVLGIDTKLATLIGVGSSICGASAIVAVSPCIQAEEEEDATAAVAIVSLLGVIGVIIYPLVASALISISESQYGVWCGLSLQGVAHAVGAAFAGGDVSGEVGTLVKMARVIMLVPTSIVLSIIFAKGGNGDKKKANFPMYVLYFVIAVMISSAYKEFVGNVKVVNEMIYYSVKLSKVFILMAMAGMGLGVDLKSFIKKGAKGFVMGLILFAIISVTTILAIINFI